MSIGFLAPAWLLLLLVIPVTWFVPRRVRDYRHAAIRGLALAMIALALARPVSTSDEGAEHHVVVLDLTASVAPDNVKRARAIAADIAGRIAGDADKTLIVVGSGAVDTGGFDSVVRVGTEGGGSPLTAALTAAAARVPEGARGAITLVSDGQSTDRRWAPVVEALAARGVPLHVVPLAPLSGNVRPVSLVFEQPVRVGHVTRAWVEVAGVQSPVEVTLHGPDGELARTTATARGGSAIAVLPFEPKAAGFVALRATVTATDDALASDNDLERTVAVQDPLRVLYLGHRITEGGPRLGELVGGGFEVTEGAPDGKLPPEGLDGFDAAVIDDRPARTLPKETQDALVNAAKNRGLGLFVSGGGLSFGAGGWNDSALADSLPIGFVHKEEKKDPSTALAIIIDTSGSMGGNRIRLAKEVTRLAIRRLLPHDKIGIVEFYGTKRWAAPLQSAANAIDIQRALNRLDAGGGTVLFPAIEEAYYGMKNAQTRYKHVVVLTDAGVETGPYESLLRRMSRDGICVSSVLVGPGRHSEFLVQMADWGGGRYYNASNRFNLPEIMLKQPSTSRLPSYRPGSHTLEPRFGAGWWGTVDPKSVPPIAGYVEAQARVGAEVILRTKKDNQPVLSSWRVGLGRVTAMLTEPTGSGTEPWRDWDGYGPFMARVLARTSREHRMPFRFEIERRDHEVVITATRRARTPVRPLASRLDVQGQPSVDVPFRVRADGVWTARLVADPGTEVRVMCSADTGDRHGKYRLVSDALSDVFAETQVAPARALDLSSAASATGGDMTTLDDTASWAPKPAGGSRPVTVTPLWPWCLLLALLAYLSDIAWRRSPWRRPVEG
ncbi:MAG: VWA domain-containing protein, partial [Planctomycetes bacterium]|nr:VWA domain-containing protein [Planctomycetota bacterium]